MVLNVNISHSMTEYKSIVHASLLPYTGRASNTHRSEAEMTMKLAFGKTLLDAGKMMVVAAGHGASADALCIFPATIDALRAITLPSPHDERTGVGGVHHVFHSAMPDTRLSGSL